MSDELKLEVPTLTIGDEPKAEAAAEPAAVQEVNIEDKIELTLEEQKAVDEFVSKIDLNNAAHILQLMLSRRWPTFPTVLWKA